MDNLWGIVENFFSVWNTGKRSGEKVVFGKYSYPSSIGKDGFAKRLMFDLYPELKCVFDSGVSLLVFEQEKPDFSAVEKKDSNFNPFEIINVLTEMKLISYNGGKMVLSKDDSKLKDFYSNFYKKIFPNDIAPIAESFSKEDLSSAYNFLKNEGYVFCNYSYEDVVQLISDMNGDVVELVNYDANFSRYKDYGAFGHRWKSSLSRFDKEPNSAGKNEELAKKVCMELVAYNFWYKNKEEAFLKENKIDPDEINKVFWERLNNQKAYNCLKFLTYFGIGMYRETDHVNIVPAGAFFEGRAISVIPGADERSDWIKAYDEGMINKYLDWNAPKVLFPGLNPIFKQFFSELRQRVATY